MIIFPLAQSPSVNHWDSFTHAAGAEYILANGNTANAQYAVSYPGAFVLSAVFSQIVGFPILGAEFILSAFLNLFVTFVLLVIGQAFVGKEKGWLIPTTYFTVSFKYFLNYHYAPALLGLCLFVVVIYLVLKTANRDFRIWKALIMFFVLTLVVVHVISALMIVIVLFFIYFAVNKFASLLKFRHKHLLGLELALFGIILFVTWHVFVSQAPLNETIDFISSILKGTRNLPSYGVFYHPIPGNFVTILQSFRYGVYGLFAIFTVFSMASLRHRTDVKVISLTGIGVLLGAFSIYLTPFTFGIERFLLYGAVVVAALFPLGVLKLSGSNLTRKWISNPLEKIIPFLMIGTFLASQLYGSAYIAYVHPDEVSAASFTAINGDKSVSTIVDDAGVVGFFGWNKSTLQIVPVSIHDSLDTAKNELSEGVLSLQYLPRQIYYFNISFIDDNKDLIYSNGLARVYYRTGFG
jgi:hypothetical protein